MKVAPIVGMVVRVLEPFSEAFPDTYTIAEITTFPDGQVVCNLTGVESAFDPVFLETVEG